MGESTPSPIPMSAAVPQGSVLNTVYVAPVSRLNASHGVLHHQYADDIQIFTKMTAYAIGSLQVCIDNLQHWFWLNGLLLNPSKSSVAYFHNRRRVHDTALPTSISRSLVVMSTLQTAYTSWESPWTAQSLDQHVTTHQHCQS